MYLIAADYYHRGTNNAALSLRLVSGRNVLVEEVAADLKTKHNTICGKSESRCVISFARPIPD